MPLAGTGCAIAPTMLAAIAAARGGDPFDATSLTEDYELRRVRNNSSYAESQISQTVPKEVRSIALPLSIPLGITISWAYA